MFFEIYSCFNRYTKDLLALSQSSHVKDIL